MARFYIEFEAPEMTDDDFKSLEVAVKDSIKQWTNGPLTNIIINGYTYKTL